MSKNNSNVLELLKKRDFHKYIDIKESVRFLNEKNEEFYVGL